jgi:signal peptidase II
MKIPRIAYAAYGFALLVIVLDQLTKAWVLSGLNMLNASGSMLDRELWGYRIEVLGSIFNLTFVENDGVSFGLFGGRRGVAGSSASSRSRSPGPARLVGAEGRPAACSSPPSAWSSAAPSAMSSTRIRFGLSSSTSLDFSGTGALPMGVQRRRQRHHHVGVILLILDSLLGPNARPRLASPAEKS